MPNTEKLHLKMEEFVGGDHVIRDPDKLKAYALDGKRPKVLVSPKTMDEISKIVAYANQHQLAVIPRGNGTKMGMGGLPERVDIILTTGRLNRVLDCDCDNLTLSVESGITLDEVQKTLAKEGRGYFLPLDPPFTTKATLGGIVATNSSGPKRLLYGTARDVIIGIKAVFPKGDMIVSGGKTVKNVSGYDMNKLLIGSMGTLGILCEMTFRLLPLPEKKATLLLPFTGLTEANGFVHELTHSQLLPASVEILNRTAVQKMKWTASIHSKGNYFVAIGLEGVAEGIERQIAEMGEMGKRNGAIEAVTLGSEDHHGFWNGLRDLCDGLTVDYPNLVSLKSNFLISKCGEMLQTYETIARGLNMDCAFVCHSGNGIIYTYVLAGKNFRSKTGALVEFVEKLTSEAVRNEGNAVVESSPLPIKKQVEVWGKPRADNLIMRRLKEEMDPAGVLNPGRFVGGI
jgi:glycolate oxidase FAD binding subunit